jgi:hypothetical protein
MRLADWLSCVCCAAVMFRWLLLLLCCGACVGLAPAAASVHHPSGFALSLHALHSIASATISSKAGL